jgi:hypothetical protein
MTRTQPVRTGTISKYKASKQGRKKARGTRQSVAAERQPMVKKKIARPLARQRRKKAKELKPELASNLGVEQQTFGVFHAVGQLNDHFIRDLPNDFASFFVGHGHHRLVQGRVNVKVQAAATVNHLGVHPLNGYLQTLCVAFGVDFDVGTHDLNDFGSSRRGRRRRRRRAWHRHRRSLLSLWGAGECGPEPTLNIKHDEIVSIPP